MASVRTTVLVPAFNEEPGLPVVLTKLRRILDSSFEVVVVDDGSTDGTAAIATQLGCRVIRHSVNRGKGEAVKSGIASAAGARIVLVDADDTYPVEAIPAIAHLLDHCDMVVASRSSGQQNIPLFNRFGNAIFRATIRHGFGFPASDPLTGMYGIHKAFLERMALNASGFGLEAEIAIKAARMRLRIIDYPIEYRRRLGQAKLSGPIDGFKIGLTIIRHVPLLYRSMLSPRRDG